MPHLVRRPVLFAVALVLSLGKLALPAAVLAACAGGWTVVTSPNVGLKANVITGTAAVSANDVWAVGYYFNGTNQQTLAQHWNGTAWSIVPSPNPSASGGFTIDLTALTVIASNDVWAAGYTSPSTTSYQTLFEHWNGTAWTLVTSPNVTTRSVLFGIDAVSATDVWAVGSSATTYATLIEHWNGTAWSIVSSPNPGTGDQVLRGVHAAGPSDVWAVGYSGGASGGCAGACQSLIEHWDGIAWSTVASPNAAGATDTVLRAVTDLTSSDAWAVGYSITSGTKKTVGMHWDGTAWSIVTTPNGGAGDGQLVAVSAIGTSDVWAAGISGATSKTLTEHWVGPAVLSLSTAASLTFPGKTVAATTQIATTTTPLTVSDTTGTGAGWKIQATSTTLTAGARTLPTTATTITAASSAAATGNCNLPTTNVAYPVTLPAAAVPPTAVSVFNATAGTGQGPATVTLTWALAVPSNAYAAAYASTVTLSIVSGP